MLITLHIFKNCLVQLLSHHWRLIMYQEKNFPSGYIQTLEQVPSGAVDSPSLEMCKT